MTYQTCWKKAFSVSCMVHLLAILLLAVMLENIDHRQLPEEFIAIELTETGSRAAVAGRPAQDSGAVPERSVSPPAVSPSRIAAREARPVAGPKAGPEPAGVEPALAAATSAGLAGGEGEAQGRAIGETALPSSGSGSQAAVTGKPGVRSAGSQEISGIVNAFLQAIEKRKDYPYIARRRGQEGTVTVAVRLTAAGELAGARVLHSSGVAALDEAALALVRRVCPFPHHAGRAIAMNIPIAYQLE
ncbi:energy transducer TonB|uniref:Outer membrane transport energization protein TonB n=1 Tax=Dendrosporobacter quercicolus TaxID=146817 RepID=A0A1G9SYT2_9FIRM|nr:TonB family protein [Dendrosporobacter quercicolus]NSL48575.1 energy transducer TonB [Dendrosporobacter quercicolus DSM 1736]SDM40542.1 outer membrane transport energization protein TonB [Dendrosporobacter quercicolus]